MENLFQKTKRTSRPAYCVHGAGSAHGNLLKFNEHNLTPDSKACRLLSHLNPLLKILLEISAVHDSILNGVSAVNDQIDLVLLAKLLNSSLLSLQGLLSGLSLGNHFSSEINCRQLIKYRLRVYKYRFVQYLWMFKFYEHWTASFLIFQTLFDSYN